MQSFSRLKGSIMKKKLIFVGIGFLLFCLLFVGIYKGATSRSYQLFGELIHEINIDQKVVALTFDDGPTKNVDQLLPLLEKYDAKSTFFLIGQDIEKYPEEAKKLVEAGHQIGNHTYSHKRMVFKSPSFIKKEIEKTDELIRNSGYEGDIDFRPPYGKKLIGLPYYLQKQNKETIMWNLEPDTYFTTAAEKADYVIKNMKPGSIILMHPMYNQTELQAVEEILKRLTNEGYTFITVDELQEL